MPRDPTWGNENTTTDFTTWRSLNSALKTLNRQNQEDMLAKLSSHESSVKDSSFW